MNGVGLLTEITDFEADLSRFISEEVAMGMSRIVPTAGGNLNWD